MSGTSKRVVVATGNPGKLAEIRRILADAGMEFVTQTEMNIVPAEETGATFLENALLKARAAATQTGLPAIADDSGLCVAALDGAPGVITARYAGAGATDADNIDKLLGALRDTADRSASFHCVAVLVDPDESIEPIVASGEWQGEITLERYGSGGFGYDPIFFDAAAGKASAQMEPAEKNSRSHRGKAFSALAKMLAER